MTRPDAVMTSDSATSIRHHTLLTLLMLSISTASASGCASFLQTSAAVIKSPGSVIAAMRAEKRVAKILCLWEPAEGQGLDGKPSRGFAGQILLFPHGSPSPIQVHGTVHIYEYVDFDPNDPDPLPIHKFTFDDGGWNAHRTESTLGQSYNVFLPYVLKNNGNAACALRVEYISQDGRLVSSPYTEVVLTARSSTRPTSAIRRNIVSTSSTEDTSDAGTDKPVPTLESTTIALPRGTRR